MQTRVRRFSQALSHICVAAALSLGVGSTVVQAQSTAAPTIVLPDFTEIVEKTEKSVVNIRTTESIPVRPAMGGRDGDPYDLFRWFFLNRTPCPALTLKRQEVQSLRSVSCRVA